MSPSPFSFYEVVVIESVRPELREIVGKRAVVMGMAEEAGQWSYAVSLESGGVSRSVRASDIRSTGQFRRREEFYDGSSIRVSKDGELLG